ncbi:MAG: hypothetical protein PVG24_02535 [Gammaproteobacteria bacterium]|jgi:hypothetical protein
MESLASILESLNLGALVNAADWVWPVCEIFHFIGMALLIGTVGLLDARILGLGRGIPVAALERLVPWGIAGFVINAVTGFIFVAGNPVGGPIVYLDNAAFQIKMVLILIAGLNLLLWYMTGLAEKADHTAADGDVVPAAKVVAVVSLVMWFGVIVFGRLIMYEDTMLYTFGL